MPDQSCFSILSFSGNNTLIGQKKILRFMCRKYFCSEAKGGVTLLVIILLFILLFLDWPV